MNKKFSLYTAIGILFFLLIGCTIDSIPKQTTEEEEIVPNQESWDVTFESTEDGIVNTKLWFGHFLQFNKTKEHEFDQNFRVEFYNKMGKRTSWITGERGKLKQDRSNMEAYGNVIAYSDSANMTLYTESLFLDNITEKIFTDDFVTITTDQDTIYGTGFEAATDFSRWEIKKSKGHTTRRVDIGMDRNRKKNNSSSNVND